MTDSAETPNPREPLAPQEIYQKDLEKYNALTQQIRILEGLSHRPNQRILEIDKKRTAIHRNLEETGKTLGKSDADVFIDMLSQEGNLKELGVDAPLVRLPMIEAISKRNPKIISQYIYDPNNPYFQWNYGDFDYRSRIGGYKRPYAMQVHGKYEAEIEGDATVSERWNKEPTFAIIFSNWRESWGIVNSTPPHSIRMARMANLSKDFNLNIFVADDGLGHHDYTSNFTYGVEVPAKRVQEIAQAMGDHPEKYWLTQDEQADPYSPQYLKMDNTVTLLGHAKNLLAEAKKTKNWQAIYNFLRICNLIATRPEFKNQYYKSWFELKDRWAHVPGDLETIEAAILKAKENNPAKSEEMEFLKQKLLEALNSS